MDFAVYHIIGHLACIIVNELDSCFLYGCLLGSDIYQQKKLNVSKCAHVWYNRFEYTKRQYLKFITKHSCLDKDRLTLAEGNIFSSRCQKL